MILEYSGDLNTGLSNNGTIQIADKKSLVAECPLFEWLSAIQMLYE